MGTLRHAFRLEHEPGRVIRGRVEMPDDGGDGGGAPRAWVLVLHGFKGFMDWGFFPELGRRLARAGLVAVHYNASGSGVGEDGESFTEAEAFATNTYSREVEDAGRVRRHVLASGRPWGALDPDRAGILGHSRGGAVALLHAAAEPYRAVATWAATARLDRWDEAQVRLWREQGHVPIENARTGVVLPLRTDVLDDLEANRERLDVLAACRRIDAPALVVHGQADEAVPFAEGEALRDALSPGRVGFLGLAGAGHTFGARHPLAGVPDALERVLGATVAHFREHLAPG